MHKLLQLYNQNRLKVWAIILASIFIIVLIQLLNNFAKEENDNKKISNENEETTQNVVSYNQESESIVSSGKVSDKYKDKFGEIIDEFYTYCVNHQPEKAYQMLSVDTKNLMYPTQKLFEKLYYESKFDGNKQYSFQSWSTYDQIYVYKVKIFEDMLSTGKSSDQDSIEDYITVVPDEDTFKLNINSYITRKEINKKDSNDIITAEVGVSDIYMNYQIYTIRLKNNTDKTIILDTRKKTNTTYITDERENRFYAMLYENKEEDMILKPQESKTIKIKFNVAYREELEIEKITFNNILNYEEYLNNQEENSSRLDIKM